MSRNSLSRALLSAVLIALGLALPLVTAAPARAVGAVTSPSLTIGIAGYGAVAATGMTDCRSTRRHACCGLSPMAPWPSQPSRRFPT